MRHREPDREDVPKTRSALAMVENIDWNVGRVLQKLDELDLSGDTIIFYFSDNGPGWRWNGDMKGRKGSVDEGGLRSPLLVRWTGKIPAGQVVEEIAGAIDLLPTLADLAGIEAALLKLSEYVEEHEEIKELDLNPVFAYKNGLSAVDARIVLEDA